jgi:hypothetical protein
MFGSSLPSSGSFLDPSELLEIQIEWVVYHIMCGYVACVPDCRGSDCCVSQLGTTTDRIYGRDILLGILLLEPCILLICALKTNKYNNYSFSLLIMYGSSYMFWHFIAISREHF